MKELKLTGYVKNQYNKDGHMYSQSFQFYPLPCWAQSGRGERWDILWMHHDALRELQPEDGQHFEMTIKLVKEDDQ